MEARQPRIILMDVSDASREVMARRLSAQGYKVEAAPDPATGADLALSAPPDAVIADLWMPSISGVQLCRLLRAEASTADVPVILRGDGDDPRSRFWAERAGAAAYVRKGRMAELVRVLSKTIDRRPKEEDAFFVQLSGGSVDIRDRIARHLDEALFDSVIAAEVRSLAACGSFDRLFDLLVQFLCQVTNYRWLALGTTGPDHFALHHHTANTERAESEAREALGLQADMRLLRIVDEDPSAETEGPAPLVASVPFAGVEVGKLVLAPGSSSSDAAHLLALVAAELGGPIRMAALMDEQQRLAAIDPLTGLRNRRSFLEQCNVEVSRSHRYSQPICMLLLDVDHFKSINDAHGHAGGDQVLAGISAMLRKQLRTSDLSARWGGEEFVIALPSTDLENARTTGERLRLAIQRLSVPHASATISVSVSLGLAELRAGESLESLIDRADRAMYCAKVGGRNRLVVAEDAPPATAATPVPELIAS